MNRQIKRVFNSDLTALIALTAAVIAVFGGMNPLFLKPVNLMQYVNNGVVLGFITMALSLTIIPGGFDYSVGSLTGFGTVFTALLLRGGMPVAAALMLCLMVMMAFGALNGVIVGYLKVPGMLATLGTSSMIYGISLVLTQGQAIGANSEAYKFFGRSDLGTLPFGVVLLLVIFVLSAVLLSHTPAGRRWYMIGTSPESARFAGINCSREVLLVHVCSAVLCFFAAVILGSRMASGRADIAEGYVLQAVTAAVFGGISIKGGAGTLTGALLGVLIFTLLTSGFTMIDLSQFYKQVATGVLLIIVLIIRNRDAFFQGRR